MPEREPFTFEKRARSFRYAWRGLVQVVATQHNAWIHAIATIVVVLAGILAGVSRLDWAMLVLAMVAVWSAEALNTAVEALGDAVSLDNHRLVGVAKDVAAGAVLVTAVGSVMIAGLVFWPHLARLAGFGR
jgi:diacylglycerol kinase (ATP)